MMSQSTLDARVRAAAGRVPGVVLLVVGPEGVRARSAIGLADLARGTGMTPNVAIPWFSMTKTATATTAVRLAERGVLDLDSPLCALVPAMRSLRPHEWAARITARQLMQHSGGLANPLPIRWVHAADGPGPNPDALLEELLAKHRKLRFEPGCRSRYSNIGILVLAAAIASATRKSFETVVHEEILAPLGMSSTSFGFPAGLSAATGYHPRRSPMRLLLPKWVAGESTGRWVALRPFLVDGAAYGGLVGTAEDAARFIQMHLRQGDLEGRRLISADAVGKMRTLSSSGGGYDFGLGWFVPTRQRNEDPRFVEHIGGGAGFRNMIRIYPSLGLGVIVMGNATRYRVDAVAKLGLDFRSRDVPRQSAVFAEEHASRQSLSRR
jgi:CubicO group peptidase (beta-lactamase class C family)